LTYRERLLCAGVAPRHVQRYVRELKDHYEDVLRAELTQGVDLATAQRSAGARLGTEDSLAQSVLERPELRSRSARFPGLVFGVGPVVTWLGIALALICAARLIPEGTGGPAAPRWRIEAAYALCIFYSRILPVLLGSAAFTAAGRRRLRAYGPIAGAAAVDLLAGTLTVQLFAASGQLGVSSSLLPWLLPFCHLFGPKDLLAVGEGLLRAACLLALSGVAYQIRRLAWLPLPARVEPIDRMRWR
jgi:hypothetical protein